jgi:hypothetical protein
MSADGVVGLLSALGEVSATSMPSNMPSAADRPRLAALNRMVEVLQSNLFRIQVGAGCWVLSGRRLLHGGLLLLLQQQRGGGAVTAQRTPVSACHARWPLQDLWGVFLAHVMEVLRSQNTHVRAAAIDALDRTITSEWGLSRAGTVSMPCWAPPPLAQHHADTGSLPAT